MSATSNGPQPGDEDPLSTTAGVQRLLRNTLQRRGGKLPLRPAIRHHVLFRPQNRQGQNHFSLNLEDVLRMDRQPNSCWLLCSQVDAADFSFYVIPHQAACAVAADGGFICRPAGADNPAGFVAARTNVTLDWQSHSLRRSGCEVSIAAFQNRVDLFREQVLPHWRLLDENDAQEIAFRRCPRCGQDRLPDYGTKRYDFQCRNGNCRLLWCGEYWSKNEGEARKREEKRLPCHPGWWVYEGVTKRWSVWDETPLRS
ncbi:hypothetical protein [Lignipirellula cremea]|uniref:Uncharacterized protein n=1 Tax=Lignipirellula cremea TaxID=2528010 RepID=A0A518DN66_9BACT|nr:hypothetical protein [Lignipirellula cremea]QDU93287.1 hypothetical protein Pla8534_10670 [Lignipirellula cremea]